MKTIIFSIVTPTYNQAQFIGKTIESILAQEGNFYCLLIRKQIIDEKATGQVIYISKLWKRKNLTF